MKLRALPANDITPLPGRNETSDSSTSERHDNNNNGDGDGEASSARDHPAAAPTAETLTSLSVAATEGAGAGSAATAGAAAGAAGSVEFDDTVASLSPSNSVASLKTKTPPHGYDLTTLTLGRVDDGRRRDIYSFPVDLKGRGEGRAVEARAVLQVK